MNYREKSSLHKNRSSILYILISSVLILTLGVSVPIHALSPLFPNALLEYQIDFEDGVEDWDLIYGFGYVEPSLYLDTEHSYEGESSARLMGKSVYRYNLSKQGNSIPFTQNTFLSFAWRMEKQEGNYIGIRLLTPTDEPYCYIQNLFWGTYANNSAYVIKQFRDSSIGEWTMHTINLTKLFWEYYQDTPSRIEAIDIMNVIHYEESTNQITNFDSIRIWNLEQDPQVSSNSLNEIPQEVHLDFESGLDGWDGDYKTGGFDLLQTSKTFWEGNSSANLCGTARFRYDLTTRLNSSVLLSYNTSISFAWRFDNRMLNYIGIGLSTPENQPNLLIQNLFWGTYANNSGYVLRQFSDSKTGTWYSHTVNISQVFLDQYGTIPSEIIAVEIMNIYHVEESTEQVSYFDSIQLRNVLKEADDLFGYLTTSPFLSLEVIVFLIILVFPIRMRKKA